MERISSVVKTFNMMENAAKYCVSSKAIAEINNNDISNSEITKHDSYATCEAMADVAFMHDVKFSSTDSMIISALVPKMKNLELSQKTQPRKGLAGYIKAVVLPTGTVVVQLASGSRILDVGTAIFLRNDNEGGSCSKKYDEIGVISDIFGSVLEPMYSLQLKQRVTGESLKMDAEVFYLHEHPSTKYISVVRDSANRYTVMQE